MVTATQFTSDPVSSRARKRFSLPTYSNKTYYPDEQRQEYVVGNTQLRSEDEAELRQAATSLYQQIDRREAEDRCQQQQQQQQQTETSEKSDVTASSEVKRSRRRSRTSVALETLKNRLSVVIEPTNEQEGEAEVVDPFLEFNGMLYSFEFGSPMNRSSRVFEAASPDHEDSYARYRPQNPASKAKKNSRYSWGGFDLAYRNENEERHEDLIAILEHDESNRNEAVTAPTDTTAAAPAAVEVPEPSTLHTVTSSSAVSPRLKSKRRSTYQEKRRSPVLENHNNDNDNDSEKIRAFIPLGETTAHNQNQAPEKKRNFIRRMSLSGLFGGKRGKNESLVNNNAIAV